MNGFSLVYCSFNVRPVRGVGVDTAKPTQYNELENPLPTRVPPKIVVTTSLKACMSVAFRGLKAEPALQIRQGASSWYYFNSMSTICDQKGGEE